MAEGICSYATYEPRWRLERDEVAAAVGQTGRGRRVVAAFDQDSTTLGVSAALRALRVDSAPSAVWFATTAPAYSEKTNATAVFAALSLPREAGAYDFGASWRSGAAALVAAATSSGLAVLADVRVGLPGSEDESSGADGAAAFVFGTRNVIAELIGRGSSSAEFLDRWSQPGDVGASTWEPRFGEQRYVELAAAAVDDALKAAGLTIGEVAAVAVAGPNGRAVQSVSAAQRRQLADGAGPDDRIAPSGASTVGVALAGLLDRAAPGDVLMVTSVADGADALVFRATDLLPRYRAESPPASEPEPVTVGYPTYLMWRGQLGREIPRRPDPQRPSAPFAGRDVEYKFGFVGGRCQSCGAVQFPTPPVCLRCRARGGFDPVPAAGGTGRVVTFTVDRLAFTPNPPLVSAVVDLDVGGRVQVEITDIPLTEIVTGMPVRLTFRRLVTVGGIHNYFWKAGPL